ncbi:gamma-aminobutyric acid type B receptor subunit 1-like [Lingula anatina]|uniref:Gamma-aminobutyric acid type B receptor subunit 1-like n=1 Tax=Lingula anatina TaxID=7574 RepID=A0A1S3IMI5_LINAN|nr:gamma-aminobutyric acid type B receptor subunit 1-like [Lingula anatina]|eukprot:XP_013398744.1 gamma-aminobutyric acid type B receptor subunit 1-like [Lingula anatina]
MCIKELMFNIHWIQIGSQLETQLREENIDVVQSLFFKANDIDKQMAKLKESGAKIILHHSSADGIEMVEVFCQAYKHGLYGKDYVWISAIQEVRNYWSHSMELSALNFTRCTVDEIVTAMESSFQTFRMDAFEAYELEQQFHMAISGRDPHRIWQEMQEQSWAQYPYIKPLYFQVAYDAVWAAALAINGSLDRIPKSVLENFTYEDLDYVTEILNQELMKLEFFGASGPVSFSKEGNRLSVIAIEQIFNGSAKAIGIYDQKTQDITWSVAANQIWRETGGKAPLAGYRQVYESRLISEIIRLTYCVVAAVAIVGAILLILFTIFKWKTKLIQNSWPVMNITIAIGCILIDISILLAGFDATSTSNAQSTCQGSTWLFILGFTLCYGTMLVKMWGIFRFYRNNVEWGIKAELRLLTAVAIMLCIDLLLLLLWQLTDPLLVFRVELAPVTNEAEGLVVIPVLFQCTSYGTMGWTIAFFTFKGLMLLVSICLIWPAWVMSIRNSIGDSSHIGLAMVCVVLAAIVGVPVSILVQDQPTVRYGVIGGFTLICTIAIVLLILVPKLIAYRKGDMEPTLLSPMRLIIDEFVEDLDSGKHNASNESRGQDGEVDAREMNVAHNVDQNEIKIENGHHSNGYF